MRTAAALLALALVSPLAAAAGLAKYKEWADSPQAYYLSKAERQKWTEVTSDEEAERFIAAYQAARGKGFAPAIQSRIDLADKEKSYRDGKAKGARSQQGQTLVLLGAPTRVQRRTGKDRSVGDPMSSDGVAGGSGDASARGGGGGSSALGNTGGPGPNTLRGMRPPDPSVLLWTYEGASVPPGAGPGPVVIEFVEDPSGNVTWKDLEGTQAVFQKVVEYWAPKGK